MSINGTDRPASRMATIGELARVSAHRARRLSRLGIKLGPRWSVLALPILWPLYMVTTGTEAASVRILGSASVTLTGSRPPRRRWGLVAAGLCPVMVVVAVLLALEVTFVVRSSAVAALVLLLALVLLCAITACALIRVARRRERDTPESTQAPLGRRRTELAEAGPAYVMTSLVAARDGQRDGVALLEALKAEWRLEGAAVVLYPATTKLVGYYRELGAEIDAGATRRMIFDFQDKPVERGSNAQAVRRDR